MLMIIFLGRRSASGVLALQIAVFQVLLRCIYPVTGDWAVRMRRVLAVTAIITIAGLYFEYLTVRIGFWNWMAGLFTVLLLLDLYDHWLFDHLLSRTFTEGSHD
jgi:hypothetical protein